jgi:hypothetical protein
MNQNTFCKNCHRIPSQCCCTPAKTLTDEEITNVYVECMLPYGEFDEHEFARAILRKAQEK